MPSVHELPPDSILEALGRAAHEVNRSYCQARGDDTQMPWEVAPEWLRVSVLKGVRGALAGNSPEQSHESWLMEKSATGWKHGPVKDAEKKEHPNIVPYAELPATERKKDALFVGTVLLFGAALGYVPMDTLAKQVFPLTQSLYE